MQAAHTRACFLSFRLLARGKHRIVDVHGFMISYLEMNVMSE